MKEKHRELIQMLQNETLPMTSKNISNGLNVSLRTVKNYISEINNFYDIEIIKSSRNGYYLEKSIPVNLIFSQPVFSIPQTNNERAYFIIHQFIINQLSALDIYDLCDILFVSPSTIKNVVDDMAIMFQSHEVDFKIQKGKLHLIGDERNIRTLFIQVLNQTSKNSYTDIQILQEMLPSVDLASLDKLVHEKLDSSLYRFNNFSKTNLLMHIAILINRVRAGNFLKEEEPKESLWKEEYPHILPLIKEIENFYSISLNETEKNEIIYWIKINSNYSPSNAIELSEDFFEKEIIELVEYYIEKINEYYFIDLSSKSFSIPFAFHLRSLKLRSQAQRSISNPMTDLIKQNNAAIFDIAVFISLDFMERYGVTLQDDEITFIAMHIGAEIERHKENSQKTICLLYSPSYLDLNRILAARLEKELNDEVLIVGLAETVQEISQFNFDLLISTMELNQTIASPTAVISPLLSKKDIKTIQNELQNLKQTKAITRVESLISRFFDPQLFFINNRIEKDIEAINFLSEKMYQAGYVDQYFKEDVWKREQAAPTSFGKFAIPHSVEMDAACTGISILISNKGVEWQDHKVYITLLIAINENEIKLFRELYETLIMIFNSQIIIDKLTNSTSYEEFVENILSYLKETEFYS